MEGVNSETGYNEPVTAQLTAVDTGSTAVLHDSELAALLQLQQRAFQQAPFPARAERLAHLQRLKVALIEHKTALVNAVDKDFVGRAHHETLLAEVMPVLESIRYHRRHLRRWMRPERRKLGIHLQPASARVVYQPLGVIGIVVPWNYPLQLSLVPLVAALSAGNRVMIKLSEHTPETAMALTRMIESCFSRDQVALVTGAADVAAAFTRLPFDHLLFTGSESVGRQVMAAAASNLTPVTLELGGKSPVIVDGDFPVDQSAARICFGKSLNGGQTCIAPDYLLMVGGDREAFVASYCRAFQAMYPHINGNNSYSAIINEHQYQRLQALLEDARAKGARIHPVCAETINDGSRRMVPCLILNASDDMAVMQEEIFGPLLPVITVDSLDQALDYVRARPRPLALYYFGLNRACQQRVIDQSHSGGVAINDTVMQAAVDDLPFGGIGPSGMGHYHGPEGFLTFSKVKPVLTKGRFNSASLLYPPYNSVLKKWLLRLLTR